MPKPLRAAERKQKTAVLPGAARLLVSGQAKQCPRETVQRKVRPSMKRDSQLSSRQDS